MVMSAFRSSVEHAFFAAFENETWLNPKYRWNGSDVVKDETWDMMPSAVHDADCQAMESGYYAATLHNWNRAAAEYRDNCIAEAKRLYPKRRWNRTLIRARAWARYSGILIWGGNGYKWRGGLAA